MCSDCMAVWRELLGYGSPEQRRAAEDRISAQDERVAKLEAVVERAKRWDKERHLMDLDGSIENEAIEIVREILALDATAPAKP